MLQTHSIKLLILRKQLGGKKEKAVEEQITMFSIHGFSLTIMIWPKPNSDTCTNLELENNYEMYS